MRYSLENGQPVLITKIETGGQTITNPPDELIDKLGLGFPKVDVPEPAYDPDEETVSFTWEIVEGEILKVWTITPLTPAEKAAKKNAAIDAQIDTVNAEYEAYKTTPLSYTFGSQTMTLKPIWVTEYYGTLMQVGLMSSGANFPATITDASGTDFTMTFEEFSTMYLWLVQQAQTEIKRVNNAIAELEAQKEVVNA